MRRFGSLALEDVPLLDKNQDDGDEVPNVAKTAAELDKEKTFKSRKSSKILKKYRVSLSNSQGFEAGVLKKER